MGSISNRMDARKYNRPHVEFMREILAEFEAGRVRKEREELENFKRETNEKIAEIVRVLNVVVDHINSTPM